MFSHIVYDECHHPKIPFPQQKEKTQKRKKEEKKSATFLEVSFGLILEALAHLMMCMLGQIWVHFHL